MLSTRTFWVTLVLVGSVSLAACGGTTESGEQTSDNLDQSPSDFSKWQPETFPEDAMGAWEFDHWVGKPFQGGGTQGQDFDAPDKAKEQVVRFQHGPIKKMVVGFGRFYLETFDPVETFNAGEVLLLKAPAVVRQYPDLIAFHTVVRSESAAGRAQGTESTFFYEFMIAGRDKDNKVSALEIGINGRWFMMKRAQP